MKEKNATSKRLFPRVFSFVVSSFQLKPKEISGKFPEDENFYTESSIYSWKTRTAPKNLTVYGMLREAVMALLDRKKYHVYMTKEEFVRGADKLFEAYGLLENWQVELALGRPYLELIGQALDLAYTFKTLRMRGEEAEKVVESQSAQKPKEKSCTEGKPRCLVVFDLDGTLIKGIKYSWTLLYQAVSLSTDMCRINKKKFENGEISYPEWVEYDFEELQQAGLTREIAQNATKKNCSLTKNFREAIEKLKNAGCAVGIISGGADVVLYSLIPDAATLFDNNIYINRLKFDEETQLLCDIEATPYDWDDDGKVRGVSGKNEGLKRMCKKYGVALRDAVFVGDDDNDFKAMRLAGMKIFYPSGQPSDRVIGAGSRRLPDGVAIVGQNDLMVVADLILRWIADKNK